MNKKKKSKPLSELDKQICPKVLEEAKIEGGKMIFDYKLAELRQILQLTQTQIAYTMGVKQPTIASLENRDGDIKLMTLKRYVEALGCKMKIDIELPDGTSRGMFF